MVLVRDEIQIFSATKRTADDLVFELRRCGYRAFGNNRFLLLILLLLLPLPLLQFLPRPLPLFCNLHTSLRSMTPALKGIHGDKDQQERDWVLGQVSVQGCEQ